MFRRPLMRLLCLFLAGCMVPGAAFAYIETTRDTRYTAAMGVAQSSPVEAPYELLYENDTLAYYYRHDRSVLAVRDKRNGYVWRTGVDLPFNAQVDDALDALSEEQKGTAVLAKEYKLNDTFIGIVNSLVVVDYFDSSNAVKSIGSGAPKNVDITFTGEGDQWTLHADFTGIDITLDVHLTLGENGFTYAIADTDITGNGKASLVAIRLSPYMGAVGGASQFYNPETGKFDRIVDKEIPDGYILLPDGCGALMRFGSDTGAFSAYVGQMYGEDRSQSVYYSRELSSLIEPLSPGLPVLGIVHGSEAAFLTYAESSEEYLEVVGYPAGNTTLYAAAYLRYVYNREYYQVFNQRGDGYFKTMDNLNPISIRQTYEFLAKTGNSFSPDYVGMSQAYRAHLLRSGLLPLAQAQESAIRLDFLMADISRGVVGYDNVVMTTAQDVANMLQSLKALGVTDTVGSLLGWKSGGLTGGSPGAITYDAAIGDRNAMEALFSQADDLGARLSLAQDYLTINKIMMPYGGNAAQHINAWYMINLYNKVMQPTVPVLETAFATPERSAQWLTVHAEQLAYAPALTVSGISDHLIASYGSRVTYHLADAKALIMNAAKTASGNKALFLTRPHQYLLAYTEGYFDAPVFSSFYLCETDAVPFLQLVLRGTMSLYAPYVNFSLYTRTDMLRMIDYNVSPSFVLTRQPSYLLADTNSCDYYSTEYDKYEAQIVGAWELVCGTLAHVKEMDWTGREVLAPGVIRNSYEKNGMRAFILINYTDEAFQQDDQMVGAQSAVYGEVNP